MYTHCMRPIIFLIIVLFSFASKAIEIKPAEGFNLEKAMFLFSDSSDVTQIEKSENWKNTDCFRLPTDGSQLWLKQSIEITKKGLSGLYLSTLGTVELYYKQEKIYQSGLIPSASQSELPGNIDHYILLPQSAQQIGRHTFYIRISREHLPQKTSSTALDFTINSFESLQQQKHHQAIFPLISLGALVVIALYYFSVYVGHKERIYLVFGLLCTTVAIWLVLEVWRPLFNYTYDLHGYRLWAISALAALFGALLPTVLAMEYQFDINKKWLLAQPLIFVCLAAFIDSYDLLTGLFVLQGFILSILFASYGTFIKREGSIFMLVALVFSLLPVLLGPQEYLERFFFILFPLVLLALLYHLSLHMKRLRVARDKALLKTQTVQMQLLKKSIQPHFLLNTLTSLSEWIERSTDTAQQMVEHLADEFYLLSQSIDEEHIPLEKEISLCEAHLKLMSLRQDFNCLLKTEIEDKECQLPPGILHTLFENAFTHNEYGEGTHEFRIEQCSKGHGVLITVKCPIAVEKREANWEERLGLGNNFISNRLEAFCPLSWRLDEGPQGEWWVTRISWDTQ